MVVVVLVSTPLPARSVENEFRKFSIVQYRSQK